MRVLLLSAYDAVSHRAWRDALQALLPDYQWTVLSLPPRYFNWRIRGNALSWAYEQRSVLEQHYDLILATSMVDLATLKGLLPTLAPCPSMVYFHENQFAYPASADQFASLEPQLVNLYSALAADCIVFNSDFNRQTFLVGVSHLLERMPDHVPPNMVAELAGKSYVIPVPLLPVYWQTRPRSRSADQPLHVLWNHRWEYDKGPAQLLAVLQLLQQETDMVFSIVGQQFRRAPAEFDAIADMANHHPQLFRQRGFISDAAAYRQLMAEADVVLSTALHDFQGLAVLEAVACGCVPLLPQRLCYGEWFEPRFLYPSIETDPQAEALGVAACLRQLRTDKKTRRLPSPPDLAGFAPQQLRAEYMTLMEAVSQRKH